MILLDSKAVLFLLAGYSRAITLAGVQQHEYGTALLASPGRARQSDVLERRCALALETETRSMPGA
jgi:hypothetical protein